MVLISSSKIISSTKFCLHAYFNFFTLLGQKNKRSSLFLSIQSSLPHLFRFVCTSHSGCVCNDGVSKVMKAQNREGQRPYDGGLIFSGGAYSTNG